MQASEDPIVEVPTVFSGSGACQRSASMRQHRYSIAAVSGYSSLSIMFLSNVSLYSFAAVGSIQVVTNVARFSRALPSSIASSCTIWYAVSGSMLSLGRTNRGTDRSSARRAKSGLTDIESGTADAICLAWK